jgi:hypothetical protein
MGLGWGGSVVEYLPSAYNALGFIPSMAKGGCWGEPRRGIGLGVGSTWETCHNRSRTIATQVQPTVSAARPTEGPLRDDLFINLFFEIGYHYIAWAGLKHWL